MCAQLNGDELTISKVGNVTLQLSADGKVQTVNLTELSFAVGLAHKLIPYGKLDAKGYVLGRRGAQHVLETFDGKRVVFRRGKNIQKCVNGQS